jgi:phosphatidate cytidylyltransferase
MLERTLSGVVFVALIFACIYFGPYTLWLFMAVVLCGCLWEYHKILVANKGTGFYVRRAFLIGTGMLAFVTFFWSFYWPEGGEKLFQAVQLSASDLTLIVVLPVVYLIFILELFMQNKRPFKQVGLFVFGLFYIALPILLYLDLAHRKQPTGESLYNQIFAIAPFILIWTNDTMAYLSGRLLGKTLLFSRISPKKTWEGTIGGIVFTLLISYLLASQLGGPSTAQWLAMAMIVSVFGSFGDLFESMLKRSVGIKDSGNIMPGHGGFLDRFDSFIFALPMLWVVLRIIP